MVDTSNRIERKVIYEPHRTQRWLMECPIGDILYGGARGGGKTWGMVGCWIQHQQLYGNRARGVWFRRSQPEIEGAQLEMIKIFPALGAKWSAQERAWNFLNGAKLKLRYLESDQDATRYQGHEYTMLLYDDAGTWATPAVMDYLRATLRSAAGVPCRMILSANPCGVGHEWLKARYLDPAPPMQPHYTANPDYPDLLPVERVFIPSKLADNPSLDPQKYAAQLALAGPAHIVRAWLEGDWDATPEGGMLDPAWFAARWDEPVDRRRASGSRLVLSVDPAEDIGAGNDETGILVGLHHGYFVDLLHAQAVKLLLDPLEELLERIAIAYKIDRAIFEKKSVGGPLAQTCRRRPNWPCSVEAIDPGHNSKAERMWQQVPWFQGARVRLPSRKAQVLLPMQSDWTDYIREMTRFTGDKRKRERDNRVDATSQMLKSFTAVRGASLYNAA